MYGNERLPGVEVSEQFRYEGSIWRGAVESTWFKHSALAIAEGAEPEAVPEGTILKEVAGELVPIEAADISATGTPLFILADKTAKTGAKVLVGTHGQVDKAKLYVGTTIFADLTDEQKLALDSQLRTSGFMLVNVLEG